MARCNESECVIFVGILEVLRVVTQRYIGCYSADVFKQGDSSHFRPRSFTSLISIVAI